MLPHTSGEWLTSSSWPTEKDSGGNVNNILRIELADESTQTQEGERVRVEEREMRGSGVGCAGVGSGGSSVAVGRSAVAPETKTCVFVDRS